MWDVMDLHIELFRLGYFTTSALGSFMTVNNCSASFSFINFFEKVAPALFLEPELRTTKDQLFLRYICSTRISSGVHLAGANTWVSRRACRTPRQLFRRFLQDSRAHAFHQLCANLFALAGSRLSRMKQRQPYIYHSLKSPASILIWRAQLRREGRLCAVTLRSEHFHWMKPNV